MEGRKMLAPDELQIQPRRVDIGEHRARRRYLLPCRAHAGGALVADDHSVDGRVALHASAFGTQPGDERVGEPARTTFGNGPTDLLAETIEDETEDPAQALVG